MADISKITLPSGSEYDIKDATARSIANGKSTVSVSQTLTSGTEIGSVTVDGTATKLYAPQGGSADALTDTEIDEAVEAAFAVYIVNVYLTNPISASEFISCTIWDSESEDGPWNSQVGSINSPTGSTEIEVSKTKPYIKVKLESNGYCVPVKGSLSGEIHYVIYGDGSHAYVIFAIGSDGTITLDGIDYDD